MAIVCLLAHGSLSAAEDSEDPLRIHLISGSNEYKSAESLPLWQAQLEDRYNVHVTRSFGEDAGNDLPGLEDLEDADVMVVFARRITLPEDQLAKIQAHCEAGKAVIGIRTASHAFQNWLEFDNKVLGGDYSGHGGDLDGIRISIVLGKEDHPVLSGVSPWARSGKLYYNDSFAPDTTLLLNATAEAETHPVAWVHKYASEGRAFYTSMGFPHDFEDPRFQRLLFNALEWTTDRKLAPARPKIK
ncbi:MAG: ThuA domain-containing protein [Opitutales bacterium]